MGIIKKGNDFSALAEASHLDVAHARDDRDRAFLAAIVESTQDAVISKSLDGHITSWNPGAERLFGYAAREVIGKPITIIIPEDRRDEEKVILEKLRRGERVESFETVRVDKHGRLLNISLTISPIRDAAGFIIGASKIARDVTQQKRIEERLRLSENQFRDLAETIPQLAWYANPDGAIIWYNKRWYEYTGTTYEQMAGWGWQQVHHPETLPKVLTQWKASIASGTPFEMVFPLRSAAGMYRPFLTRVMPLKDNDGEVVQWMGTNTDIGELRELQEALRKSEYRFRHLADTAPAMLWISEPDASCSFMSHSWMAYTGQSENEVLGQGWLNVVHPEDREQVKQLLLDENRPQKPFSLDYRIRRHDGQYRWVNDTGRPRYGESREFLGYIGSVVDIHERKQAEESLRHADQRKDEFLSTLAHELRNPLAPIRSALEIIRRCKGERNLLQQACDIMDRQLDQMVRLVDDLMDLSRITRDKLELRLSHVNLAPIIQQAIESSQPLAIEYGHEICCQMPPDAIILHADSVRLAQALGNLLNNACRYTPRGGLIELIVEQLGQEVRISVKDNGVGIPPEKLQSIFERYYQVDKMPQQSHSGLGIGLTLVKQIIELHQGRIEAISGGSGKGSVFAIYLPVSTATEASVNCAQAASTPSDISRRVLVVDDNKDSAISMVRLLELYNHELRVAHDGRQAVQIADSFQPEVILLDIGLPGLTGLDVCRRIREQPWGESALLIAVTGWGQEEDQKKTQQAGFDLHMIKPIDCDHLLKILETLRV